MALFPYDMVIKDSLALVDVSLLTALIIVIRRYRKAVSAVKPDRGPRQRRRPGVPPRTELATMLLTSTLHESGTAEADSPQMAAPVTEPGASAAVHPAQAGARPADDESADDELTDDDPFTISSVALHMLGAHRSPTQQAGTTDMPVQELQVTLGDDRIQVVLAQAPAADHRDEPRSGHTWVTSAPYLVWRSLPHDIPDGGIAFACLGVGDEGCLFIDLAAAPGTVAIRGESAAAVRLAESVAHQLCMRPASSGYTVVLVGDVLPEPLPSGAMWVASNWDLSPIPQPPGPGGATEVVLSRLDSNDDAFALGRYASSSNHRVVPVVLSDLLDAPWSFTAYPNRQQPAWYRS
jgi:hypothetical protein